MMYFINQFNCLNQLIILILLISISQTHQSDTPNSLKTRTRQGRNTLIDSSEEFNDKTISISNLTSLPAESRQSDDDDFNLPSSHLSSNNLQPIKSFERRNSINAPDFQANAAGFILPDYLANSQSVSSSSNNILNKLAPYETSISNGQSNLDDFNSYLNEKSNSFVPSSTNNLRERRKGFIESSGPQQKSSHSSNYNIYERQLDDQNQFDPLAIAAHKHHMLKHQNQHNQARDNEFASNSILESVSSPLDNQDFGFSNNFIQNDFATSPSYNNELTALNNLAGLNSIRSLGALSALSNPTLGLNGLNGGYSNLGPLSASSSSLVGTLGGNLNGLNSVVPPGAIVGAPGSQPPPGMKLAGYVTVTNPSPNVGSMVQSPNNLLASPATQQQMLLSQVMNRSPQAQALAQVMAQSMAQGIRIPFASNPYGNNLQLIPANGLNGQLQSPSSSSSSSSSNSNSNNSNNGNSNSNNNNSNSNSNLSNGEQQVAASSNRAKFLQRLNPLNLFRRLRTRNQKNNNSKQNNKDQSNTSNEINNNIPDLEDRSQYFLPADLLLGSASSTNQQQQLAAAVAPQLTLQQPNLAEQLAAQIAQLNLQLAQQSNNKAKFLRKMGNNYSSAKKVFKRDITNQLNQTNIQVNNSSDVEEINSNEGETIVYSLGDLPSTTTLIAHQLKSNGTSSNDTEAAENGFFPVADIYQNYKFNIRPRFRFPSAREQRRISNVNGLHVNTNNFLTSSSMKNNFIGLMGSRNYEVISGGILNNEGHRNTDHSMLHGMHSNNANHPNHKLPHHHQTQRNNLGQMLPNKGNKFNIDNDFDDDDEEDDDSMNNSNGYNNSPIINNGNSNQRNGNNVMFLDDLFGSNMHNGQGKNNIFGFQGFNSKNFNGNQHFNALSSASTNNQQLNNTSTDSETKTIDSQKDQEKI